MNPRTTVSARRILCSFLAVGAFLAGALTFATPVHAVTTVNFSGASVTVEASVGETIFFRNTSSINPIFLTNASGSVTNNTNTPCTGGAECSLAINSGRNLTITALGTIAITGGSTLTITAPSNSEAEAIVVDLSVNVTSGYRCNTTLISGDQGTWSALPGQSDCAPPADKPNAKLLGWATQRTFPVGIAKRQVDNGWGVYETFDSTGQLTGVFIPVGKVAWLTSPGQIYSIWSE